MRPLCVFLCSDKSSYQIISDRTRDEGFHRYFVLKNKSIVVDKKDLNEQDSLINFDFSNVEYTTLARMVVAYSDAQYSDFFVFKDNYQNIDEISINEKYLWDNEIFYFSKDYVVFEGYNFTKEIIEPTYEYYQNINKALAGEIVSDKYFIEAIKELLADVNYIFDKSSEQLPAKYKSLFKSNTKSEITYSIFYESNTSNKNSIIFTKLVLDSFKYKITNDEELNCYFL